MCRLAQYLFGLQNCLAQQREAAEKQRDFLGIPKVRNHLPGEAGTNL